MHVRLMLAAAAAAANVDPHRGLQFRQPANKAAIHAPPNTMNGPALHSPLCVTAEANWPILRDRCRRKRFDAPLLSRAPQRSLSNAHNC